MTTAHLVSGLPCSGKTTYSEQLSRDTGGIRFSLDYWLITAFGTYSIETVGHDEHVRRVLACRKLIWSAASEFLRRDIDVILDDGFFLRRHRMEYAAAANKLGAAARIHCLHTPVETLRSRLEKRNADLPAFNFRIDPARLESFIHMYEEPSEDEGNERVVVGE